MRRKLKAAAGEGAEAAAPAERVIRRRRPRQTIDHTAQTQILVSGLLKARAGAGGSAGDALAVVSWARGVHEEGTALKALSARVRKVNAPGVAERKMTHEVNKALLDGVLAGTTTIDVDGEGNLIFGDPSTSTISVLKTVEDSD
jgi:hypothetical protein